MSTITIPKKVTKGEELIVISRKDYEEFSRWQKTFQPFKEFAPTSAQKKDLKQARREYQKGEYLTIYELRQKLATENKK